MSKDDVAATAPQWVAGITRMIPTTKTVLDTSEPYVDIQGGLIRHMRGGTVDIARGTNHLCNGRFRIEFVIRAAAHSARGFGIIIGVSDAECPVWGYTATDALPETAPRRINSLKPFSSWGFDPSSGCLISSSDPNKGRFGGTTVGMEMVERSSGGAIAGTTVVIEADVPPLLTKEQVVLTRRHFSTALHPLEKERNFPRHMRHVSSRTVAGLADTQKARSSSLTFSINGGDPVDTGVRLPESGVFPFVHLTGEGDAVELLSITKLA